MSADDKTSKSPLAKKEPGSESKTAETTPKTEAAKTESAKPEASTTGAAPANKGMGEGQKPVSQAYKDNWNAIFGKKTAKKTVKKTLTKMNRKSSNKKIVKNNKTAKKNKR